LTLANENKQQIPKHLSNKPKPKKLGIHNGPKKRRIGRRMQVSTKLRLDEFGDDYDVREKKQFDITRQNWVPTSCENDWKRLTTTVGSQPGLDTTGLAASLALPVGLVYNGGNTEGTAGENEISLLTGGE